MNPAGGSGEGGDLGWLPGTEHGLGETGEGLELSPQARAKDPSGNPLMLQLGGFGPP